MSTHSHTQTADEHTHTCDLFIAIVSVWPASVPNILISTEYGRCTGREMHIIGRRWQCNYLRAPWIRYHLRLWALCVVNKCSSFRRLQMWVYQVVSGVFELTFDLNIKIKSRKQEALTPLALSFVCRDSHFVSLVRFVAVATMKVTDSCAVVCCSSDSLHFSV